MTNASEVQKTTPSFSRQWFFLCIWLIICSLIAVNLWQFTHYHGVTQVYFSRSTALHEKVIQTIEQAQEYVYFAIYTFTRSDIAQALIAANMRGVTVQGILDANQTQHNAAQKKLFSLLQKNNIPLVTQPHSGIMHLKILITEKAYLSGSYNWTSAASNQNDEILEINTTPSTKNYYRRVFLKLYEDFVRAEKYNQKKK